MSFILTSLLSTGERGLQLGTGRTIDEVRNVSDFYHSYDPEFTHVIEYRDLATPQRVVEVREGTDGVPAEWRGAVEALRAAQEG